jgi:hypothetical protein
MAKLARRGFLKRTTASVATIGVMASVPAALTAMTDAPQITETAETDLSSLSACGCAYQQSRYWRDLSPVRNTGNRLSRSRPCYAPLEIHALACC